MRLSNEHKNKILEIIKKNFGKDSTIILFGSRVDDNKRGGDIDILVEHHLRDLENLEYLKIQSVTQIQLAIGIQKIDLVVTSDGKNDNRLVIQEAFKKGIVLS